MKEEILSELIEEIEDERCVMLLGPEFITVEGESIISRIHQEICADKGEHIAYYYPNDNLFLFHDDLGKEKVRREIRKAYKNYDFPLQPYKQILELPLPLIISLNPDTFLSDLASRLGLPHDFSHFRFSGEAAEEVSEPTKQRPLIYNLFGSRTEDESLILNYEDLFNLLKAVLPNGLPDKIRSKLHRASSFLFLGCDFEKWYTQLILQLLTGERKGRPKFAIRYRVQEGDARNFLMQQFRIDFLDPEEHFFDTLYEHLARQNMLRTLRAASPQAAEDIGAVRQLIADGQLGEAIAQTRGLLRSPDHVDSWTKISNQFQEHQRKMVQDLYLPGESETMQARLVSALLHLLKELR